MKHAYEEICGILQLIKSNRELYHRSKCAGDFAEETILDALYLIRNFIEDNDIVEIKNLENEIDELQKCLNDIRQEANNIENIAVDISTMARN